jgi:hypothetical protein
MPKPQPNKLAEALRHKAQGTEAPPVAALEPIEPKETTRRNKVMVSGWLPIEARSSFRLIQAKHPEKRMQDLVEEAINDLFAKYNVPQTAKLNSLGEEA